MPRYTSRPRSDWWDDDWTADRQPTTVTVHEEDDPVNTGILDKDGNPIYRMPEKGKLGYV